MVTSSSEGVLTAQAVSVGNGILRVQAMTITNSEQCLFFIACTPVSLQY